MVVDKIGGGFFVVLAVGFSWWLLAWVSSKVVGVGFGGWNGGGYCNYGGGC